MHFLFLVQFLDPLDYFGISQDLALSPGLIRLCIDITIVPDAVVENSEMFTVSILVSDPTVQVTTSSAQVTILDGSSKWVEKGIQYCEHAVTRVCVLEILRLKFFTDWCKLVGNTFAIESLETKGNFVAAIQSTLNMYRGICNHLFL